MRVVVAVVLLAGLTGCIAKTAVDVVTLPVKAAGKGVDMMTTSQSEADRNRGRAIRKQEEREAKERRRYEKEQRKRAREAAERYD